MMVSATCKKTFNPIQIPEQGPFGAKQILITNEPTHEILALFVLRKFILQTHMRSHPVGLDV